MCTAENNDRSNANLSPFPSTPVTVFLIDKKQLCL